MIKFRTTSYIILTTVITVLLLSACNNNITSSTNESSSLSTTTTSEVFPVIYTVVFDARGGSEVEAQQVGENELLIVPHTLKQGYTLEGWYTSLENNSTRLKWDFSVDKVTSDLTLYANWSVNEYTISFVSNGGSEIASIK